MTFNRFKLLCLATVFAVADQFCFAAATNDNLLLRLQFAGTTVLAADTNAAYLTKVFSLPETSAFGTQIVAKAASLPAKWLGVAHTNRDDAMIRPVLAEWLARGFSLELHGDKSGVSDFAIATKADAGLAKRWASAWDSAGNCWSLSGQIVTKHDSGWFVVAGAKSKQAANAALAAMQKSIANQTLVKEVILEGELASALIPEPIQRSVYGGFERLHVSVSPANQTLKVAGKAFYKHDLPKLGTLPAIPTNLIVEADASFTMVRQPTEWLAPDSPINRLLPDPLPEVVYFWGGRSSPFGMAMAVPFTSRDEFASHFGSRLHSNLVSVAAATYTGPVELDTNRLEIHWQSVPFTAPVISVKESGTNSFLVAEASPISYAGSGLTAALRERALAHTNSVIYDWEFTQAHLDTWFRVGQLALMVGNQEQLRSDSPTAKWLKAASIVLPNGGNMFTEITQTGPRELSLDRRAPLAFSSIELFWLANWLESENFPAANFFVPNPNWDTQKDTLK